MLTISSFFMWSKTVMLASWKGESWSWSGDLLVGLLDKRGTLAQTRLPRGRVHVYCDTMASACMVWVDQLHFAVNYSNSTLDTLIHVYSLGHVATIRFRLTRRLKAQLICNEVSRYSAICDTDRLAFPSHCGYLNSTSRYPATYSSMPVRTLLAPSPHVARQ
jgi:hypothetical protein